MARYRAIYGGSARGVRAHRHYDLIAPGTTAHVEKSALSIEIRDGHRPISPLRAVVQQAS
jgi:hypothetical protein